jgi:hypothetical protein
MFIDSIVLFTLQVHIYAFDEPLVGTPVRIEAMADVQLEFAELTEPMAVGSLVEVQVSTHLGLCTRHLYASDQRESRRRRSR